MAESAKSGIEGFIEDISARKVSGWARNPSDNTPVTLEVLSDGKVMGETVADRFRKDLLDSGKGDGKHAFEMTFPAPILDYSRAGAIEVRVRDGQQLLPLVSNLLRRLKVEAAVDAPSEPSSAPPETPDGKEPTPPSRPASPLDTGSAWRIESLAFDAGRLVGRVSAPGGRQTLLVTLDGTPIGNAEIAAQTDTRRVARAFSILIPFELQDGGTHRVVCFDGATGRRLEGGTVELRLLAPSEPGMPAASTVVREPSAQSPQIITVSSMLSSRTEWLAALCTEPGATVPLQIVIGRDAKADVASLVGAAARLGASPCTAVIAVGTDFSTLLFAGMIRRLCNCPLLVDVGESAAALPGPPDFAALEHALRDDRWLTATLDAAPWKAVCSALIAEADGLIAANPALRRQFGGMLVREGCDEATLDPARFDRAALRARYELAPADRVIMVSGAAARPVADVAEAIARVADSRLVLATAGEIRDSDARERVAGCTGVRLIVLPEANGDALAEGLALSDAVAVLSEDAATTAVAPLLIDALAMDLSVLTMGVPPIADLLAIGAVLPAGSAAALDSALRSVLSNAALPFRRQGGRAVYLGEFGRQVNGVRMALALDAANARRSSAMPFHWQALFRVLRRAASVKLPHAPQPGAATSVRPGELIFVSDSNDTDLEGSRIDRILRHLVKTQTIHHVVQFDAPLSAAKLEEFAAASSGSQRSGLIYAQTVKRVLSLADGDGITRRVFLHRTSKKPERLIGRELPAISDYAGFIRQNLADAKIGPAPVFWVLPDRGGSGYSAFREVVTPSAIVLEIAQQNFPADDPIPAEWIKMIGEADVIICQTEDVLARVVALRPDAELVVEADNTSERAERIWALLQQVF